MSAAPSIYCVSAEFASHEELIEAVKKARAAGYQKMEAYTPYPVEELPEAFGRGRTAVPLLTLLGGMIWGLGGFFMEWFAMGIGYPLNVGGRPYMSWPSYIPVTFELTVLGASLTALVAMIALNRLPQPYHPVFNLPDFERASQDRFFLCIEASDPKFDLTATKAWLETLHPIRVGEASW